MKPKVEDLIPWTSETYPPGKTVGRLTVKGVFKKPGTHRCYILCGCSCGTDCFLTAMGNISNGDTKSCGCLKREVVSSKKAKRTPSMVPWNSPTYKPGMKFNRLTITATMKDMERKVYYANTNCDCGTQGHITTIIALVKGRTTSCGCYQHERAYVHGLSNHPLYSIWSGMINRCKNNKQSTYEKYGAKGITVCERWTYAPNFIEDMHHTYAPGLQIDRIDNSKGYSKDNCRWVTHQQQVENRRCVKFFSFNGESHTLPSWAKKLGINEHTLYCRIHRQGWSIEKALTTPILHRKATQSTERPTPGRESCSRT